MGTQNEWEGPRELVRPWGSGVGTDVDCSDVTSGNGPAVTSRSCVLDPRKNETLDVVTSKPFYLFCYINYSQLVPVNFRYLLTVALAYSRKEPVRYIMSMWLSISINKNWTDLMSNVYWTVHHCNSWRIKGQLGVNCYFISLLMYSTGFGHQYIHHQERATVLLNYHIRRFFSVRCLLEIWCGWFWVVLVLQAVALIKPNRTKSPTHIEMRTRRPMR